MIIAHFTLAMFLSSALFNSLLALVLGIFNGVLEMNIYLAHFHNFPQKAIKMPENFTNFNNRDISDECTWEHEDENLQSSH